MQKLFSKGIKVPRLLKLTESNYSIEMEYINGPKLKDVINNPAITED